MALDFHKYIKEKISAYCDLFNDLTTPPEYLELLSSNKSPEEIFSLIKKDADRGLSNAQYYAGYCCSVGFGVQKSYPMAYKYFRHAVSQNHVLAMRCLAYSLEEGRGCPQSDDFAFHCYQHAAENGDQTALAKLGHFYYEGRSIESSIKKADDFFQKSADRDSSLGFYYIAERRKGVINEKMDQRASDYLTKRFNYFKLLADQNNNPLAQVAVGIAFEDGIGVEPSVDMAFHYYELAAEQNHPEGQFLVAECYANGIGAPQSMDQAIFYYTLSSKQNCAYAYFQLGYCLQESDPQQAIDYLKLAINPDYVADQNLLVESQYILFKCFEKQIKNINFNYNEDIEELYEQAVYYLKKAAENGLVEARIDLGKTYLEGNLGHKKSDRLAFHYFQLAAENGDAIALENLGHCYEYGLCVARSLRTAIDYYGKAAAKNHPEIYEKIGVCYEKMGGNESKKTAYYNEKTLLGLGNKFFLAHLLKTNKNSLQKAIYFFNLALEKTTDKEFIEGCLELCLAELKEIENPSSKLEAGTASLPEQSSQSNSEVVDLKPVANHPNQFKNRKIQIIKSSSVNVKNLFKQKTDGLSKVISESNKARKKFKVNPHVIYKEAA